MSWCRLLAHPEVARISIIWLQTPNLRSVYHVLEHWWKESNVIQTIYVEHALNGSWGRVWHLKTFLSTGGLFFAKPMYFFLFWILDNIRSIYVYAIVYKTYCQVMCFRKRHAIMHFGVAHLQLNQWKTRVDGLEWECKLCSPPITPRQSLEQIGK